MSAIAPTFANIGDGDGSLYRVIWTPVTENDTCVGTKSVSQHADKSIQVIGTFGSASVALHGSNDGGVTYAALHDAAGNAIAITAAGITVVLENTEYIKPVVTGGTGQSLSIAIVAHLSNPMRT